MKLQSPCAYQGGKQRIASQILDIINPDFNKPYIDLCCGSGQISLELLNRGFPQENLFMFDISPYGHFWQSISKKEFDLDKFRSYIDDIPQDPKLIQEHIKNLSKQQVDENQDYIYLILQAGSFGGKQIWQENLSWKNCSFRSLWLPTATSNRKSHVNPMMPMPNELLRRVEVIVNNVKEIKAYCCDIMSLNNFDPDATIYADPPYANSTAYGYGFDLQNLIQKINHPIWISEGKSLSDKSWLISGERKKGGISGERKNKNEEWLSYVK